MSKPVAMTIAALMLLVGGLLVAWGCRTDVDEVCVGCGRVRHERSYAGMVVVERRTVAADCIRHAQFLD